MKLKINGPLFIIERDREERQSEGKRVRKREKGHP